MVLLYIFHFWQSVYWIVHWWGNCAGWWWHLRLEEKIWLKNQNSQYVWSGQRIGEWHIWPQINARESSQECGEGWFGKKIEVAGMSPDRQDAERRGNHHCKEHLVGSQNWLTRSLPSPSFPPQGQTMCLILFNVATVPSTALRNQCWLIWFDYACPSLYSDFIIFPTNKLQVKKKKNQEYCS